MIVIFAEPNDVHAATVQRALLSQLKKESLILDVADYPTKWRIDLYSGSIGHFRIRLADELIDSECIEGIWRRRVRMPRIHEAIADPEVRNFCLAEASSLFKGTVNCVPNVLNSEHSELLASHKAYQLKVAMDVGLLCPETLISSDSEEVGAFYEKRDGNIVFKALTAPRFQFSETRLLTVEHLQHLSCTAFTPTIFQQRIEPKFHLRITIVDGELFVARIHSVREFAVLDWRLDPDPAVQKSSIEDGLAAKLISMMQTLGLRYGAIDLIVGVDGNIYFLEVNPGGQYLFVEVATAQPISVAIARAISSNGSP